MRIAARWVSRVLMVASPLIVMTALVVAEPQSEGKSRADEFRAYAKREIARYTIRLVPADRPLALQLSPVLKWSNPIAGEIYGDVFIWTWKGRPEVIGSLHKWYSPHNHSAIEFLSVSTGLLVGHEDGREMWTPSRPGIEMKPIPGAPGPAMTPVQRLRQMRELSEDFTGLETRRNDRERDTRLLTQPLYRYVNSEEPVVDGALFVFDQGTDPETFLLIEARQVDGKAQWQYGLARMNSVGMRVNHRGKEVWAAPLLPWEQVRDRREPYMSFTIAE